MQVVQYCDDKLFKQQIISREQKPLREKSLAFVTEYRFKINNGMCTHYDDLVKNVTNDYKQDEIRKL